MRDLLDSALTNPVALFASIDGMAVPNLIAHRHPSPVFNFNFLDPDNVQSFFYGFPVIGLVEPIIADGYWLLLEPFSTGPHTLHGSGDNIYHDPHDVTSHITVEQVPLSEWIDALKLWVNNGPARRTLLPDLNQADALFQRGKIQPGINRLRSFQNKVETRVLPVNAALAHNLMRYAERIIQRAGREM
jgi:hypothetical protein